jgi:alanine racemase
MKDLLTKLSRRRFPYEPLIAIEISRNHLIHNLNEFKKIAPKAPGAANGSVAPVLKSNAYGHGLLEVAHALKDEDVPFFVVDSYFEALALRSGGFKPALLIIGYNRPETMLTSRLKDVSFTVTSIDTLLSIAERRNNADKWQNMSGKIGFLSPLSKLRKNRIHIHLKIDTGMRRQGIMPSEIARAIEIIKDDHYIVLDGICSHLCDADDVDESFTESQISIWNQTVKRFQDAFPEMRYAHLSATDGNYFTNDIDANVSRLGIGLYGLSENPALLKKFDLKPVMTMKTIITGVKQLKKEETVGYGNTFKAEKDMTIATIPVGYFEGIDRRLSSRPADAAGNTPGGIVQVGPNRILCPIIGRVSMNISIIDISKADDAKIGDAVVVISDVIADPNSVISIAKKCDTISYEIIARIPEHLKRVVVA